jgi:hypothetical protein
VFRKGRDETRLVSVEEIQAIKRSSGAVPVVLSHWQLSGGNLQQMGLRLVFTSPHGAFWPYEDLYVYADTGGPKNDVATAKP